MSAIINVVNGPSKFDLMMALFTRKPQKPTVTFALEHAKEGYLATITGVSEEDGSGESWNIRGFLQDIYFAGDGLSPLHGALLKVSRQPFKGYFSTADRKGWLTFID